MIFQSYFHNLTKRNWGATFHFILAGMLYFIFFVGLNYFADKYNISFEHHSIFIIPFLATMFVGYLNEALQKSAGGETMKGFWEDSVANLLGTLWVMLIVYVTLTYLTGV